MASFEWKDPNVYYHYLKNDTGKNILSEDVENQIKQMWQPRIRAYYEKPGTRLTPLWGERMIR